VDEVFESGLHGEELLGLSLQVLDVGCSKCLDLTARATAVLPEANELANLGDGEA
jgi:hypothetical protein